MTDGLVDEYDLRNECRKAGGEWDGINDTCELDNMNIQLHDEGHVHVRRTDEIAEALIDEVTSVKYEYIDGVISVVDRDGDSNANFSVE